MQMQGKTFWFYKQVLLL